MNRIFKYLSILIISVTTSSCNKDEAEIIITDFSESQKITLEPYKFNPYAMMNIWVTGNVDDTIVIKLNSKDSKPLLKLSGEIKERWYSDYYGEGPRTLIFEPYKATKGELKIEFKL